MKPRGHRDRNRITQGKFLYEMGWREEEVCISQSHYLCMCSIWLKWPLKRHFRSPFFISNLSRTPPVLCSSLQGIISEALCRIFHKQINEYLIFTQSKRKLAWLSQCLLWKCVMFDSEADGKTKTKHTLSVQQRSLWHFPPTS